MEALCRLCGKVNLHLMNILDGSNENLKLEIYNLLHIEVHQCDFLPTKVCTSCVAVLKEASAFINCCHHVQKILKEKYEADCQDLKVTELVSKTSCSNIPVPSEVEGNGENNCNEEHSIVSETEHSFFVEEPKQQTFVDSDELISEIVSNPLKSEHSTSVEINENRAASNIKIIQNELTAPLQFEISGIPHSIDDSMNEENFSTIKPEAIELDDCFVPDLLEMESNETDVSFSESLQNNVNVEMKEKNGSTLNSVLLESTQKIPPAIPINLDDEVQVKTDQNYLFNSTNFLTQSIDTTMDTVKEENDKSTSTKTLLCVTLTRISESEYPQKSTRDFASDSDEDMYEPDTDPQKLYDYCMQVAEQVNLKNYVDEPWADSRIEQQVSPQVPPSQFKNKSTNPSHPSASIDTFTAEDSGSKNNVVSNKKRTLFKCGTCQKKFRSKSLYDDHINIHTGYRPFQCEICLKTYSRRSDLSIHSRVVHAQGEFKCSLCDYVASHEGRLKGHMKTSHEKPLCCGICNYRCGAKRRMQEHIVNKHQNVVELNPPEICELCGGSFKGKMSLRAHQQKVHFPEPQMCSICGKQCPNQSVYKTHVSQCGKEKIRYKCDMCGQTYSKKAVLKEHMNKHLNIKPYECKLCNKKFFLRVRLLTHMSVHRAPTFQCEVCYKSFNRKDNMKSHMKKHFENEGM